MRTANTDIEGVDVELEYEYEPAEEDIGIEEVFRITGVICHGGDIIEWLKDEAIELLETRLYEREIE